MPTGRLAVWWVLVSEIVIFGGAARPPTSCTASAHAEWAEQAAHTNTWAGAFNTLVLLTSSLSAVLAHQAAEQRRRQEGRAPAVAHHASAALIFLIVKAFEWTHEIREGFTITSSGFWSFYYTAAGLHAFHVIAGMVIMLSVALDARKNEELQRVENDRHLLALRRHRLDLPVPAAVHRQVGRRTSMSDHAAVARAHHTELRQDLGDPRRRCSCVSVVGPMLGIRAVTLITAFGIALVKAYLVAKNFMHLNVAEADRPLRARRWRWCSWCCSTRGSRRRRAEGHRPATGRRPPASTTSARRAHEHAEQRRTKDAR